MIETKPVLLTFCIPTYNRSGAVYRLVTRILSCPDRDIEVVVLDNGSTDETLEVLGRIADARLRVHANGWNRGALFNMVNVFGFGSGEYLVYSTDQDSVDPALIPDFKSFLAANPEVACGYCSFGAPPMRANEIFGEGFECLSAIAYKGRHPTGYFFKNANLTTVRLADRLSDFEMVDLFPLEFAFGEIGSTAAGAIYHRALFSPNTGPEVATHKSATTNGTSRAAFFAPASRLKLAVSYSKHIEKLDLSGPERSALTAQVFISGLRGATIGFREIMRDERLCMHYRMSPRDVSYVEMLGTAASFSAVYVWKTFSHRMGGAVPFIVSLLALVWRKIGSRTP